ncbi:hypothetical protein SCRM01_219 [Synechococcus phage S-CRM01]|uniref:hypothetical protein n=1 Tax=Synechococcus phage S-CRM01 TaxID=1026955 RepID=UPI000209E42C|nr:hypothetical protein SCRM01_219 [Synechococcus phage S-CRM01]AEC53165.1 hypothetical protein SCRM01_219 [Synechococcus phage S-CRM01]
MITTSEHNRLLELYELIKVNGVQNMKQIELDEFSALMALSLDGCGDGAPVQEVAHDAW